MVSTEEKYGDLSNKELFDFLAEIKDNDESIESAEIDASEKINDKEIQSTLSELPENAELEAYYGDNAWRKPPIYSGYGNRIITLYSPETKQKAIKSIKETWRKKTQVLKENRIRIQREAFNQNRIQLSDKIEKHYIKQLISLLVQEHTRMIDKYSNYINKRLTMLLNPFIPRRLRMCQALYPNSIRSSPGFTYKASKEYGGGLLFWATPDIPYYFEQGTEQELLVKNKSSFLIPIDKAVISYHEHLKKRQEKELKYASLIVQKGVQSYFDLLKLNPFWFETLYNAIK